MNRNDAIVNPVFPVKVSQAGPLGLMVSPSPDLKLMWRLLFPENSSGVQFYNSRLHQSNEMGLSLVGPMIGAPYAVILLESLIVGGITQVIFVGWCGSLSPELSVGDVVVPSAALVDEGVSPPYGVAAGDYSLPAPTLMRSVQAGLTSQGISFREGPIWSTDAIFRETPQRVAKYQHQGLLAVEMETSALFTVAAFREIEAAAVLIVSDELATFTWRPGFTDPVFKSAREAVCEGIIALCRDQLNQNQASPKESSSCANS